MELNREENKWKYSNASHIVRVLFHGIFFASFFAEKSLYKIAT